MKNYTLRDLVEMCAHKSNCQGCDFFNNEEDAENPCKLTTLPENWDFHYEDFQLNQVAKADAGKIRLTLVPREILRDIAVIRMYGNAKYPEGGDDNWKRVSPERYRDAAFRHFLAYLDDPKGVDEESGYPHLWHLACNIAFLCEMEAGNEARR